MLLTIISCTIAVCVQDCGLVCCCIYTELIWIYAISEMVGSSVMLELALGGGEILGGQNKASSLWAWLSISFWT